MTDASSNRVAKNRCPDCDGLGYWYGPDGERIICPHAIPNRVGNEPKECPKCSSQAPWFHTHCGLCGTPLDATRNRVQAQDSLAAQLERVHKMAVEAGEYDAADFIYRASGLVEGR